ncbi:TldD/PmbA family protein [Filobacillus milosensis]|uniref:TldD/PmbA family protein n=1 Tax=Filobacillus milosensis TaxID=94137 RepID=A0A4Y8IGV9_9BACI|nr:TldD/PmbA family protein [Filobacillus milosensis]TFB14261.1 TldD/PmbA family protein [Filobacillus milosensis]
MLSQSLVQDVLNEALTTGGDFAEVFVEDRLTNNLSLQGGLVENSLSGRDFGVGIRLFKGFQSTYTYTTDFTKEGMLKAAKRVAQTVHGDQLLKITDFGQQQVKVLHPIQQMPQSVDKVRKVNVLKKVHESASQYSDLITQVSIRLKDEEQNVLIANSEGAFIEDQRVRNILTVQSIASEKSRMESGYINTGALAGLEHLESIDVNFYGSEASRIAATMLDADPCPSGTFPVVIDNKFGGVIFHEACGHSLEASAVAKNKSVFSNKLGEKVASDLVTYIDDGTLQNEWGSINIDDEGEAARRNVLIENGILKGYLVDKLNARIMNTDITGSSRRESYRFAPTSRMTNTFIAPGESTREDIISNTEYGIFAKYMGGGQVNPATGDYNFGAEEAYIIKNGKIDRPVRGATLIGNGAETLKKVDMVGNNLGHGAGMCGASSGAVPVNVGQPTLRVSELTVGGTKGDA